MREANLKKKHSYNRHVVKEIVEPGLCVRCGACEPACPVNIIRFDGQAYPYITDEDICILNCTKCIVICPGEVVDFPRLDRRFFGSHPHPDSITGIAKRALVAFATNNKIRKGGSSGGLVTQLLIYMLENKLIDGALVLGSYVGSDGWQPEPMIARTVEDLQNTQKSKYTLIPHLRILSEIEEKDGRYAIVGLPCHIHAIRRYQKFSKNLAQRIKLVIGLYCNVAFEPYVVDDLCDFNDIEKTHVTHFDFRHGAWPGGIVAQCNDGSLKKVLSLEDWKDEFNLLKFFYVPSRCNTCIDFSAEYADIAVGDPWIKGRDGKLLYTDNRTTVLVRTDVGDQLLSAAEADGYIGTEEISLRTYMVSFEGAARYKRSFVPQYMLLRRMIGLSVPKYYRDVGSGNVMDFPFTLARIAILGMSNFKWFRRSALFLAQTRFALACFAWNRRRKERKFRVAYAKHEDFVERVSTAREQQ
ncbi:MAG: Coenzyme F420 hydrogenase/dehydrogenase, beta subunit C-terminal domain [Planctomycetota bacterium]|jgi:coenzyme F420 hydrogenase subunit beta